MSYLGKLIQKQQKEYRNRTYVLHYSKDVISKCVKHDEFIELVKDAQEKYKKIKCTSIRKQFPNNCFTLIHIERANELSLYIHKDKKFYRYYTKEKDAKNIKHINPLVEFKAKFKERTNIDFIKAFGKVPQYFKTCVPQPIYYQNKAFGTEVVINHVSKEDFSSHYPWAASQLLPDATTMKIVNEYVKPTDEYQFCFYPETGHIAIYNEFDTHNYTKLQQIYGASDKDRHFKTDYLKHETYTVVLKASKFKIAELGAYYDIKNSYLKDSDEYNQAKLFLNKFLGMFQMNNTNAYNHYPYAHLAAVIIWRANIKMFNLLRQIRPENVIQVCVDGVLHVGQPQGTNVKQLGNLITEETNAKLVQKGINQYIVFGKEIHKAHAGLDINIESNNIKDWQASTKVDITKYIKSFIEVEDK